jgi:CBS domain-containing protein
MHAKNRAMLPINKDQGVDFLGRLRDARALVLQDAESFHDASTVLEHIGQVCAGKIGNGLKSYETAIVDLATNGDNEKRESVRRLFNVVRVARNKAVHDGAFARHLSSRLVELILLLEESIMQTMDHVEDLMVRNPVTAEPWHLISHVRKAMLANSFSNIPVFLPDGDHGKWKLLTDTAIMRFIRIAPTSAEEKLRLAMSITHAIDQHALELTAAHCCPPDSLVSDLLPHINSHPVLITEKIHGQDRLLGIITAFDFL